MNSLALLQTHPTNKQHRYQQRLHELCSLLCSLACLLTLLKLPCSTQCASVYMTVSASNNSAAAISVYTLSFNRSLNALAQPISPSPLASNYLITLTLDPHYTVTSSISSTPAFSSLNSSSKVVSFSLNTTIGSIVLGNMTNPLPSGTALPITIAFFNASSPTQQVDTSSASLTFQSLTFAPSALSYALSPGNVSSTSNLTLSIVPFFWDSNKMYLSLSMPTYWSRNMLNITANEALSSLSYCSPSCLIQSIGGFFVIEVSGIALNGSALTLTIVNILSPATLEASDSLSVSLLQSSYNSDVQTGKLSLTALYPNQLQILTTSTSATVGQQVTLSLTLVSQDLFASNDSIIITLGTSISMAAAVTISNPLVTSHNSQVQQSSRIMLTAFTLVTSIPSQFSGTILLSNITAQYSVQPVTTNAIGFYRNGALYDQSSFSFSVVTAPMISFVLSLSSTKANQVSNLTVSVTLSVGVNQSDILHLRVDQAILVNSCSLPGCSTCVCTFSSNSLYRSIRVSSFPLISFGSPLTTALSVLLEVRNPVSSGYTIQATTTDSANYSKESSSTLYPNISQSVLPSSLFTLHMSNEVVYSSSNYSLMMDFSNHSLLDGWMLLQFSPILTLLDPSNPYCLVNGINGQCSLTLSNSTSVSNSFITANISISKTTSVYYISVNNLRNPNSTAFFSFKGTVNDLNGLTYYSIDSSNYRSGIPYALAASATSSNCTNSQANNLTLSFSFLPFTPSSAVITDDNSATLLKGQVVLEKIGYPIAFSSSISLSVVNSASLQPVYYRLLVKTADYLYDIFSIQITVTNCISSYLSIISYLFTGLPEDQGTLTFSIDQLSSSSSSVRIDYLTVAFPSQYPSTINISSNAINTIQLAPRVFNLTVGSTQPITIDIWGYTSVLSSSHIQLSAYSLSLSGNNQTYRISSNSDTLLYNLTALTNCTFPCKTCSQGLCLQCYSSALTPYYMLDSTTHNCVTPSSCPTSTYANYSTISGSSNASSYSGRCSPCPAACLSCFSLSRCSSCAANFYLLNDSCLTDCPSGYYPVTTQQTCQPCTSGNNSAHCLTCVSLNQCSTCLSPYLLDPSSQTCISSCSSTQLAINGVCYSCQYPCSSCNNSTSTCSSCLSGYYLSSGQCLTACLSPLVPDSNSACVTCSSSCLTCSTSPTICTSCSYPFKLLSSVCINDCPLDYYTYIANNNTLQCLLCAFPCLSCSSQSICLSCQTGYYYLSNSCLLSCPPSYYPSINNNNGSALFCSSCSSNCLSCASISVCTQCQVGYYLSSTGANTTVCTSSCLSGQFLSNSSCIDCSANCISCLSLTVCLACSPSSFLMNAACLFSCDSGYTSVLKNFPYLSSNITTYQCVSCSTLYSNCMVCTNNSCTSCLTPFLLSPPSSCISICVSGYLNISNICSPCSSQCSSCSLLADNCSSCSPTYLLYYNSSTSSSRCIGTCPSGTYNQSGQCQSCSAACLTCSTSSIFCLSCSSSFYLLGSTNQCVSACPSNSYPYQNKCIICSSSCTSCNSYGCSRCASGYLSSFPQTINSTVYYSCSNSCPPSYPYQYNSSCLACTLNCLQCNSSQCLQCAPGWLGYNQYCLTQCPPSYGPLSGICVFNFTPSTNQTPVITNAAVPIPFSIVTFGLTACILISKYIHKETFVSLATLAVVSLMTALCDVFYLLRGYIAQPYNALLPYLYLILAGLIISYVNNVIFIFLSRFTLERDDLFLLWKRGNVHLIKQDKLQQPSHQQLQDHLNGNSQTTGEQVPRRFITYDCLWKTVLVLGSLTSHMVYTLVFSRLFGLALFNAQVRTVKTFQFLNYLWVASLLAFLLPFVSGIVLAASLSLSDSFYLPAVYEATDLLFLNFIFLLLGFLLLKKKKQIWSREDTEGHSDEESTKKVIFERDNNDFDLNNIMESQEQINGRIMNSYNVPIISREGVISSSKGSTVEEDSQLYFQKGNQSYLERSEDMHIDGTNIFMQIAPSDMHPGSQEVHPDLIEKHSQQEEGEDSKQEKVEDIPRHRSRDIQLQPEGAMEAIDLNALRASSQPEPQEIYIKDQNFYLKEQQGEQTQLKSPSLGSPKEKESQNEQPEKAQQKLLSIQQEAEGLDNSATLKKNINNLAAFDPKQERRVGDEYQAEIGPSQKHGSMTIKPDSIFPSFPRLEEAEQDSIGRRGPASQQTRRGRRNKNNREGSRYEKSPSRSKVNKESVRVSGLAEMFNSYKASSPSLKPMQVERSLKRFSLKAEDSGQVKEERPIKQETPGRVSSSAQHLRNILEAREEQLFFQNSQGPMTEEPPLKKEQREEQLNRYAHRTIVQQTSRSRPANNSQSIYKSINISKFNDRLGGKLRGASRNVHPSMPLQSSFRSVPKLRSKSREGLPFKVEVGDSQRQNIWNSRAIPGSRQQLTGTTTAIEWKSRMASSRAQLQHIYTPRK